MYVSAVHVFLCIKLIYKNSNLFQRIFLNTLKKVGSPHRWWDKVTTRSVSDCSETFTPVVCWRSFCQALDSPPRSWDCAERRRKPGNGTCWCVMLEESDHPLEGPGTSSDTDPSQKLCIWIRCSVEVWPVDGATLTPPGGRGAVSLLKVLIIFLPLMGKGSACLWVSCSWSMHVHPHITELFLRIELITVCRKRLQFHGNHKYSSQFYGFSVEIYNFQVI